MKKPRNNLFKINLEFFNFEEVLLQLLIIFVNSKTASVFKYHFLTLFLTVVLTKNSLILYYSKFLTLGLNNLNIINV